MFSGSGVRDMASMSPESNVTDLGAELDLLDLNAGDVSVYGSLSAGNTPEPGSLSVLDLRGSNGRNCGSGGGGDNNVDSVYNMNSGSFSEGHTPEPGCLTTFALNNGSGSSSRQSYETFSAMTTPEPLGLSRHHQQQQHQQNSLGPIGSGLYASPGRGRGGMVSKISPPNSVGVNPQIGEYSPESVSQLTTTLRRLADALDAKNGMGSPTSPSPRQPTTPIPISAITQTMGTLSETSGLILNDVAIKNLQNLAQYVACGEPDSRPLGIPAIPSPTPTMNPDSTVASPVPNGFPARQGKVNTMQIRCKFGQLGSNKGQFSSPHGFCLGIDEEIVIADTNNHRICIFDKNGEFKSAFGVAGKDEGQLWYPRKVAFIRNNAASGSGVSTPRFVICDRGSERSRMQIFTRNGHFVRKIAIRYIDIVAGLAITPNGHIVAVDSVSPTVFVIAETGDLLRWFDCSEHMREPSDVAVANNEYYICDFKGHCVTVFSEEGQYLRRIGYEHLTNFPNGIDVSDAGDILIGDSHGNRFHVVVFDKTGTLLGEFECPYVKVSRCCGLKITSEGYVVTLAKNNHHVLVLNTLYIM